jgi:hypothetical protein
VAAAGVAALGVAGMALGLVERPGSLRAGATEFVNDRSGSAAHTSPSVAADPRNPAVIAVADRLDAPELGCSLSRSTNAGATWAPVELPPGLAAVDCFWPRVAYLPDGTLLVLYTALGGPNVLPLSVWLQRFDDRGAVGPPLQVAGDLAFYARVALQGDRLWLTWVQANPSTADRQLGLAPGDNPIVVARSDDGGRTFGPPVRVSPPGLRVIQPSVVVGPGGRVTVAAIDLGDDVADYEGTYDGQTPPDPRLRWRVLAWTSSDAGATFGPTSVVAADLPVPQPIIADLGPTPGLAVDPRSGRLYVAWDAGRGQARNCYVAWSGDGGRRWSKPIRVGPVDRSQLLPAVSVAPGGRVDVVFFDRSRDRNDVLQNAVAASSTDGGRTFRAATVSDAPSDSRIGLGSQLGVPVPGDNLAVLSRAGDFLAFWPDTGRGTPAVTVADLAVADVDTGAGAGRRWGYAAVGATLVLAAAALVAVSRRPAGA